MFDSYIKQLQAEYKKSPWLKYTAPAIFVLLSLYIMDTLWQSSSELSNEYSQLLMQEGKIISLQEQADWEAALAKAKGEFGESSDQIWFAESLELASADLQTELRSLAKDRITALRINMSPSESLTGSGLWLLSAEITGKFQASETPSLLFDLSGKKPALAIDRFSYFPARNQTGVLQISALVSIEESVENILELTQ